MFSNLDNLIKVCSAPLRSHCLWSQLKYFLPSQFNKHSLDAKHEPGFALFKIQDNEKLLEEERQGKTRNKLHHIIATCEYVVFRYLVLNRQFYG